MTTRKRRLVTEDYQSILMQYFMLGQDTKAIADNLGISRCSVQKTIRVYKLVKSGDFSLVADAIRLGAGRPELVYYSSAMLGVDAPHDLIDAAYSEFCAKCKEQLYYRKRNRINADQTSIDLSSEEQDVIPDAEAEDISDDSLNSSDTVSPEQLRDFEISMEFLHCARLGLELYQHLRTLSDLFMPFRELAAEASAESQDGEET